MYLTGCHLTGNRKIAGGCALLLSACVFVGAAFGDARPVRAQKEDAAATAATVELQTTAAEADTASTGLTLSELAAERDIMALLYLADEYDVRAEASQDAPVAAVIESGQTVRIRDAHYNEEEETLWIRVAFVAGAGDGNPAGGAEAGSALEEGYVERELLACSDERFLRWERAFRREHGLADRLPANLYTAGEGGVTADIAQFPESYQEALAALKAKHPKWIFVPMNTGLDWKTVITEELKGGKSLVHKSFPDYTKDGAYDDGNWFYATRGILEYYMDPRNGFTEDRIFQFELLTYNETYHTEAAVEQFLQKTFMKSPDKAPGTTMTYAHIFWAIGAEEGREVSPFHLAARVYQEQGQGTSGLISGKYPGYEGYYNYFNVGASGTTTKEVIENGLKYAKAHNWYNAYFSILGGADVISANYIKKGQDTLYLQKYNVNPKASNPLYTHQYMQNISAPTTEGASIKRLYAAADSLDNSFVFKIPVYQNMPETACPYPSPELRLQIPTGYDSTVWIDGEVYPSESSGDSQVLKLTGSQSKSAVVYRYDEKGIPTGMYVWTLSGNNGIYTATAQPRLENLLSYHGFSVRVAGDPGLRMKSGISTELKQTLKSGGVDGYKLKEYGTLMADYDALQNRPPLKGGEGVLGGMAYGTNSVGTKLDMVYETVDGRDRFTAVLMGLSPSQYRTAYSFRAYAVLEKGGAQTVLYGPVVTRSLTQVAQQVLSDGVYASGSPEEAYLRKLLSDAEAH